MDIKAGCGIFRWLLLVLCLLVGGLISAQTKAQPGKPSNQPPTAAQSKTKWIKDPNSVMPMRQMTNAQRRAAAERTRARRAKAEALRRQSNKNSLNGVQQ